MKITTMGAILACKNLGTWLATMSVTNVRQDPTAFLWLFMIYVLINVPTDLLIANHLTEQGAKKVKKTD
jgi:hypothetical protein